MLSEQQFPFLAEKGHVVSLVGGGGKTTLLYAFARHCAAKGWRVLVSTTTHILQPERCYAPDDPALQALWAAGEYAVAGTPAGNGKLSAPPMQQLQRWMREADAVFLEADGAKRMPCKVPAEHEPVPPSAGGLLPAGNRLQPAADRPGDHPDPRTSGGASGKRAGGTKSCGRTPLFCGAEPGRRCRPGRSRAGDTAPAAGALRCAGRADPF